MSLRLLIIAGIIPTKHYKSSYKKMKVMDINYLMKLGNLELGTYSFY